jgi:hypothetical protein
MNGDEYLPLKRAGNAPVGKGPLVLATVFAIHNTLAPTGALLAAVRTMPLEDVLPLVPEIVRPARGTLRVLRELEALEVPLVLVGSDPEPLVQKLARVFWFTGETIAAGPEGTVAATLERVGLPPSCIWFVTADIDEASAARDAGINTVLLAEGAEGAFLAPDERGFYVIPTIDELLEVLRIPYTRSVINLRHMYLSLIQYKPRSESAP